MIETYLIFLRIYPNTRQKRSDLFSAAAVISLPIRLIFQGRRNWGAQGARAPHFFDFYQYVLVNSAPHFFLLLLVRCPPPNILVRATALCLIM